MDLERKGNKIPMEYWSVIEETKSTFGNHHRRGFLFSFTRKWGKPRCGIFSSHSFVPIDNFENPQKKGFLRSDPSLSERINPHFKRDGIKGTFFGGENPSCPSSFSPTTHLPPCASLPSQLPTASSTSFPCSFMPYAVASLSPDPTISPNIEWC